MTKAVHAPAHLCVPCVSADLTGQVTAGPQGTRRQKKKKSLVNRHLTVINSHLETTDFMSVVFQSQPKKFTTTLRGALRALIGRRRDVRLKLILYPHEVGGNPNEN